MRYWDAVRRDVDGPNPSLRMVALITNEAHCILREMVPSGHALSAVDEFFDDARVAQRVRDGVLDCCELIRGLCVLLKTHCAPARDVMVEDILKRAAGQSWGGCLERVFEVMEVMKLDLANHHVRLLRPTVITTLTTSESSWFLSQLASGAISLDRTRGWLNQSWQRYASDPSTSNKTETVGSTEFFHTAFLDLVRAQGCSGSQAPQVPETFTFDSTRLTALHREWAELATSGCVAMAFRQLFGVASARKEWGPDEDHARDFAAGVHEVVKGANSVDNLAVHVAFAVERVQGGFKDRPDGLALDSNMVSLARSLLTRHLDPGSTVYRRVHDALGVALLQCMEGQPLSSTSAAVLDETSALVSSSHLQRSGLSGFESRVIELARRMLAVAELNRRTYGECVYKGLVADVVGVPIPVSK
ncbi:hypothetical protein HDU93_002038 [Gonapodya sp. JEL0774]|nr:hypothetical protein HDU93_002038 [Gonapodya sp. JEL0774]